MGGTARYTSTCDMSTDLSIGPQMIDLDAEDRAGGQVLTPFMTAEGCQHPGSRSVAKGCIQPPPGPREGPN